MNSTLTANTMNTKYFVGTDPLHCNALLCLVVNIQASVWSYAEHFTELANQIKLVDAFKVEFICLLFVDLVSTIEKYQLFQRYES